MSFEALLTKNPHPKRESETGCNLKTANAATARSAARDQFAGAFVAIDLAGGASGPHSRNETRE